MLCREDLSRLWELKDDRYAVMVVKHPYRPQEVDTVFGRQDHYPMKYWSSLMLFNNARCCSLTPEYVNSADRLDLHQFKWIPDETRIGELPARWNHLVGIDTLLPTSAIAHFTLGIPSFKELHNAEFSDEWFHELRQVRASEIGSQE